MDKDYEYFAKFLENPKSYPNREFYEKVTDRAKYVVAHAEDFNYLEDDAWKEIRERLLAEPEIRGEIHEEFKELKSQINMPADIHEAERVKIRSRWLSFIEKHRENFEFSEEQIADYKMHFEKFADAVRNAQIREDNLKLLKAESRKEIEKLDDALAEHYRHTGKRVVLTSLRQKTIYRGN